MNRNPIDPPIVCVYAEDGSVEVFRSLREAENAVEGIDIHPDDVAFDRHGRLLAFEVGGVVHGQFSVKVGSVMLVSAEDEASHRGDMEAHLRRHFRFLSELEPETLTPAWAESASLDEMLTKGLELEAENRHADRRFMMGCTIIVAVILGLAVFWRFVL